MFIGSWFFRVGGVFETLSRLIVMINHFSIKLLVGSSFRVWWKIFLNCLRLIYWFDYAFGVHWVGRWKSRHCVVVHLLCVFIKVHQSKIIELSKCFLSRFSLIYFTPWMKQFHSWRKSSSFRSSSRVLVSTLRKSNFFFCITIEIYGHWNVLGFFRFVSPSQKARCFLLLHEFYRFFLLLKIVLFEQNP